MVPNNHTTPDSSSDTEESTVDSRSGNGSKNSMVASELYGTRSIPDMSDLDLDDPLLHRKAALRYAESDFYVFPLRPGDKRPDGTKVPNGSKDATIDPELIKSWWPAGSKNGIGLNCGMSGIIVIDVDHPETMVKYFDTPPNPQSKWLLDKLVEHPSARQLTRAKGVREAWAAGQKNTAILVGQQAHVIYGAPDEPLGGTAGALGNAWGEIRAGNLYIAVWPTIHPKSDEGGEYEWDDCKTITPLPEIIERKLRASKPRNSDGSSGSSVVGRVSEGGRNITLFNLGCSMRGKGFGDAAVRQAVRAENAERCTPPLDDSEVDGIIDSIVSRYEPGEVINIAAAWSFLNGLSNGTGNVSTDDDIVDDEDLIEHLAKVKSIREFERAQRQARYELDAEERVAIQSIDIISGDSILQMEDLRWLVTTEEGRGVLATTGVFELTGQRQQFKTAIILDLLLSIVNKLDHWLTWPINTSTDGELPHVVLAIGEGGAGIRRRVEAWLTAHEGSSLDRFHLVPFNGFCLTSETDITTIITTIKSQVGDAPVAVTVFDAFPDIFTGNEDKSGDVGRAVTGMKRIAKDLGGGLCGVTQHTGHDPSRGRGSSRLPDAVDTVLHIENRVIYVTKVKEDDRDAVSPIPMSAVSVGHSFVVRRDDSLAGASARNQNSADEVAKRKIRQVLELNGEMTITALRKATGMAPAALKRRLEDLANDGAIDERKAGAATFVKIKVISNIA